VSSVDDFAFGYSRSLGWDLFNGLIAVMAWLVAAGLLLLMLALVGVVRGARALWDLRRV
jgi:hypothetical protein